MAASVGVETVAPGEIVGSAGDVVTVRVGERQDIVAAPPTTTSKSVFVCIRAEDVVLETAPRGQMSASNQLHGRVTDIRHEGAVVRVYLDCGFPLSAIVTRPACEELHLENGTPVIAVVKATAVHLIGRHGP